MIVSQTPTTPASKSKSELLDSLLRKRARTEKALVRCKDALSALKAYFGTLNAQHVGVLVLPNMMESYDAAAEPWDDKALDLEEQLARVKEEIAEEQARLQKPHGEDELRTRVGIDLSAAFEGEVEITLTYGEQFQILGGEGY